MNVGTAAIGVLAIALAAPTSQAQAPWMPDRGDGNYLNPVLFADYSDPDVTRVGDDFYLVSSSFSSVPGLPILHSKDLVNWSIVGHAATRLKSPDFDAPQPGKGLWAPSLRHQDGRFWIYVGDPDRGIFVTTAVDPRGPWSPLSLVKEAKGAIDPCPLWDEDGKVYLVHAWAKSRAGFNSVLTVTPLAADGLSTAGPDTQVFDGRKDHPTIEGPKFYKRNGWYYIFAPAGGVATGWQTVLRSKRVMGPYEDRVVLRQGKTEVNGPHQGAWVETRSGESWFLHFQDRGPYGRVVHLQPMVWKGDWPIIGADPDGDEVGEPLAGYRKPVLGAPTAAPQTGDEFDAHALGLQWQWNANPRPEWASLTARPGWLRLTAVPEPSSARSVFHLAPVLLQKIPAEEFTVSAEIDATSLQVGQRAGLVVMGRDSAFIAVERRAEGMVLVRGLGQGVDLGGADQLTTDGPVRTLVARGGVVNLRASFVKGGRVRFDSPEDPAHPPTGAEFQARPGVWVGTRIGLFASSPQAAAAASSGHADVNYFRVEPRR